MILFRFDFTNAKSWVSVLSEIRKLFRGLILFFVSSVPDIPLNPCDGNPCGPNSVCRPHNYQAVCSCLPNYIGRPPNCRPECIMDSDCPTTLACRCDKCVSPCDGTCGPNAHCTVLYHKAHCVCNDGFTGDPYSGCGHVVLCKNLFLVCLNGQCE